MYEKDIDHIVGVIHQSDFFELYLGKKKKDISEIMKKPVYISETIRISDALKRMQKAKVHMAVVVDQYGGTEGIATLEDIIEELVGEIYDESDEEEGEGCHGDCQSSGETRFSLRQTRIEQPKRRRKSSFR